LDGTWIIDEIRLAVAKVYKILEIREVYQYEVTQYNPDTGEGGLFVEYINTFLKLRRRLVCILGGFKPLLMKIDTFSNSLKAKASTWTKTLQVLTLRNLVWQNSVSTPCGKN
jgi:hypothetical protein